MIDSIFNSIKIIQNCDTNIISDKEKLKIFCRIQQEFGGTALCLSGGATMTYYQIGAIKCLLDNGVLPYIICGTSGGALVGSMIAVRSNEELQEFLTPENCQRILNPGDEPFCVKLKRFIKTGYIFDWDNWKNKLRKHTKGDMTFLEAYKLTGKIFNVTAISNKHEPILLNYKTVPHVGMKISKYELYPYNENILIL